MEPGREGRNALEERLRDRLIDAELWRAGCGRKNIAAVVNHELFDAVVIALLAGLTLDEVADAMRAGWPELGMGRPGSTWMGTSCGKGIWIARTCATGWPATANSIVGLSAWRLRRAPAGAATWPRLSVPIDQARAS